jgi:hypothetical protein
MAYGADDAVRTTRQWYGPRTREYSSLQGVKRNGQEHEFTVFYDQNSNDVQGTTALLGKIPKGAKLSKVLVYVEEAAVGGTNPTVTLGSSASGSEIVSAPIDAVGTEDGTEGAAVGAIAAADLSVYIDFTGSPTTVGKGKIVVQYDYISY